MNRPRTHAYPASRLLPQKAPQPPESGEMGRELLFQDVYRCRETVRPRVTPNACVSGARVPPASPHRGGHRNGPIHDLSSADGTSPPLLLLGPAWSAGGEGRVLR